MLILHSQRVHNKIDINKHSLVDQVTPEILQQYASLETAWHSKHFVSRKTDLQKSQTKEQNAVMLYITVAVASYMHGTVRVQNHLLL